MQLAERLCQQTKFSQAAFLDTLAASYAENGEFDKALQQLQRIEKMPSGSPLDAAIIERRELYRKKQPFREEN